MRKVLFGVAALLLAAGVLQLFFAGYMVFQNSKEEMHEAAVFHSLNGQFVLRGLALLAIIFAALARAGKRTIWLAVGIFLMSIVQLLIFIVGGMLTGSSEDFVTPAGSWVASIHPVTGMLIIFMSYWLFLRSRALLRASQPAVARAEAGSTAQV
ncbi:hypothetical protein ACLH0K_04305 [Arthrobacter sp. MPF02]|uniref:hypothetical protein n=1 Tax=Arthrobacter sp. MPF02 TaxID=3388492 RepID=UPI0039847E5E